MKKIADWLNSCSFEDEWFAPADEVLQKQVVPFFEQPAPSTVEEMIISTLKLYKEVLYIRDQLLPDLKVNYITRKDFACNVMLAWQQKHPDHASIIQAVCYELF